MDLFSLPNVVAARILQAGRGRLGPRLTIKFGLFIIATI